MSKIKSTLNFVKLWPTQNRAEDSAITIVSDSQDAANIQVNVLGAANVLIERDTSGNVVFQSYLKSVEHTEIYEAKIFDMSTSSVWLHSDAILEFIINNEVRLVPTPLKWETSTGEPANWVTHDVYVGKKRIQGYSIKDAIHLHLHEVETANAE